MEHRGRALAAVVVAALAVVLVLGDEAAAQDLAPDGAPTTDSRPTPCPARQRPRRSPPPGQRARRPRRLPPPACGRPPVVTNPAPAVARRPAATTARVARTRTPPARHRRAARHHRAAPVRLPVARPPSWAVHVPALSAVDPAPASSSDRMRLAGAGVALLLLAVASGALLTVLARGERLGPRA